MSVFLLLLMSIPVIGRFELATNPIECTTKADHMTMLKDALYSNKSLWGFSKLKEPTP